MSLVQEEDSRDKERKKKKRETRKIKQDCLTNAQLKESIFSLHARGAVQILS
jgi:hypothetical protein